MGARIFVVAAVTCLTAAHSPGAYADGAQGIEFARGIPGSQTRVMERDLNALAAMTYPQAIREYLAVPARQSFQRVMGFDVNSASLLTRNALSWLQQRVQYVVGESFDLEDNMYVASERHRFPNPTEKPTIETPTSQPRGGGTAKTVMSNIGAALYYAGKDGGVLLGLKIPGEGRVRVSSPRTGIIKIGEGLFAQLKHYRDLSADSIALRISRLATFFHEGRHSDGNGKSLGFFHATCPAGHDYAGLPACDRNLNGPYTVGYLMLSLFRAQCAANGLCNTAELAALSAAAADSYGRVLRETRDEFAASNGRILADALQSVYDLCRKFPDMQDSMEKCHNMAALKREIDRLRSGAGGTVASTDWDARPEGRR